MKLGFSSFSTGWAVALSPDDIPTQLAQLVAQTKRQGLTLLQVGDNLPLEKLQPHEHDAFRALLTQHGIALEIGMRGLTAQRLDMYIDLSRMYSCKLLRAVIDAEGMYPTEQEIMAIIQKAEPKLRGAGVRLAIENHDRFPAYTLRHIIESVVSPFVGICLDTANSLGAAEGINDVMEELLPYVFNLHVKDFTVARIPGGMGFTVSGAPAGSGMLNIPAVIRNVQMHSPNANCILELWTPQSPSLAETLAAEQAGVAQGISYLKRLAQGQARQTGASAAYTIARFGPRFTISDICASLYTLGSMGFSRYQPEVSFTHAIADWENGGAQRVYRAALRAGVGIRQMIAHFIMEYFCDSHVACTDDGLREMERFLAVCKVIQGCRYVLLPVGPLRMLSGADTSTVHHAFWRKLSAVTSLVREAGFIPVFELLPENYIGGYAQLDSAADLLGGEVCFNLDTSHAYALGEDVEALPCRYGKAIVTTHLADTTGTPGEKLPPGQGVLDWATLLQNLCSYASLESLDWEVVLPPDAIDTAYLEIRERYS